MEEESIHKFNIIRYCTDNFRKNIRYLWSMVLRPQTAKKKLYVESHRDIKGDGDNNAENNIIPREKLGVVLSISLLFKIVTIKLSFMPRFEISSYSS